MRLTQDPLPSWGRIVVFILATFVLTILFPYRTKPHDRKD